MKKIIFLIFLFFSLLLISFIVIGGTQKMEPRYVTISNAIKCRGLMKSTTEKTIMKDLPELYKNLQKLKTEEALNNITNPWEYISLSTNFKGSSAWDYYTGYKIENTDNYNNKNVIDFVVPTGDYAVFELRCKSKLFFGIKMGMLKQKIYTQWLPKSEYKFDGYEYEYNTEEMWKKSPYDIDLYVKITKK